MNLREISDTSVVISVIRFFYECYDYIKQRLTCIYHNSHTYKLTKRFWTIVKACFRNCFLGRITETKQTTSGILDNSRLIKYLFNFYKRGRNKIIPYLKASSTIDLAKNSKKDLYLTPVRILSIVTITATTVNVILSFALHKQISTWGWLMRGLFLFLAISGLFCKADWPTVKKNSAFLRNM